MHNPPLQYVLVFVDTKNVVFGYCRLSPSFPGCFPFVVCQPLLHLTAVFKGLKRYLLPEKDILKLTFANEELSGVCGRLGLKLNYKLLKMMRYGNEAVGDSFEKRDAT
jgi:hypothetical protein